MLKYRKIIYFVLALAIIFAIGVSSLYVVITNYIYHPLNSNKEKKIILIKPGQNFDRIVNLLSKNKLIKNPFYFKIYSVLNGREKKIKAGEFELSSSMTPLQILNILTKGKEKLYKITIPEGYTIKQIAQLVEDSGLGKSKDFLIAASDTSILKEKGINGKNLEGFLFPDTYYFPKNTSEKKIINKMFSQFWKIFNARWEKKGWKNKAKEQGFTINEIVTLASIIEKEAGQSFEMPIISSVFHNRLKRKMRLESDPTVIYGIKNFDGNIKRKHLKTYTPYNTYLIKGLPKGAIANPGFLALKSALFPKKTSYLFFVSKKDKTHKFSENIKQHNKAVRKYQLRRRPKKG